MLPGFAAFMEEG